MESQTSFKKSTYERQNKTANNVHLFCLKATLWQSAHYSELNAMGYKISRVTVAKYMKELGLRSKLSKKFKVTTDSKHNYLIVDNVLNRNFAPTEPSQAWVSDITYIQTKEGFVYLTSLIDLYDRKMIGWSLSNTMSTADTTLAAWRMAIKNRPVKKGLIFHSDQGVQYAGMTFWSFISGKCPV